MVSPNQAPAKGRKLLKRDGNVTDKSKRLFVSSFIELLRNGEGVHITVGKIADGAGLTRRTFYRHFDGTEGLASYAMEACGRGFADSLARGAVPTIEAYAHAIFSFWQDELPLLRGVIDTGAAPSLLIAWIKGAGSALHSIDAEALDGNVAAAYLGHFMTGGIVATLTEWAADENRPSATTMARIITLPMKDGL